MAQTNTNTTSALIALTKEIGLLLGQLLPISIFLFIQALPAQVLAATTPFSGSLAPLRFPFNSEQVSGPQSELVRPGMVLGVTASAYSSTIAQTDDDPFTTASGTHVRPGIVAANFLPLGTIIRVNGVIHTVEDRMNARFNDSQRIDVWMASTEQARSFGVRGAIVEIVSLPN